MITEKERIAILKAMITEKERIAILKALKAQFLSSLKAANINQEDFEEIAKLLEQIIPHDWNPA